MTFRILLVILVWLLAIRFVRAAFEKLASIIVQMGYRVVTNFSVSDFAPV
ncbi:MAG: hypothetical protein U0172_11830 [Nitrospiraceae bacterium]